MAPTTQCPEVGNDVLLQAVNDALRKMLHVHKPIPGTRVVDEAKVVQIRSDLMAVIAAHVEQQCEASRTIGAVEEMLHA